MNTTEPKSLFEIDTELDGILETIQDAAEIGDPIPDEILSRFHTFCQAHGDKVDRIGRFVRMMESREAYCRGEAVRLVDRAKAASGKVERTKSMVMFYLLSRNMTKVEGREFTLRVQKNSQDSVKVASDLELPMAFRRVTLDLSGVLYETVLANLPDELGKLFEGTVNGTRADNEAIRDAIARAEIVPGAELRRGTHLRVA